MTAKQTSQLKPKARNGKSLMSQLLNDTRMYIEQAEQTDVESLRQFLFTDPERPLIAMGHGGSHPSAAYASLLYGTNCGLGRAVTPYQANSLSDETLKNSKLLLISKSLMNQDAVYIAQRMARTNPEHSCVLIMTDADNANMKRMLKSCPNGVINHPFDLPDGFISVNGTFAYFSLLYKAFTDDADFSSKLALSANPVDNFTYRCVDGTTTPPDLSTISQFTVLYGSYGEPVANKLESNMTEAGLASCVISDFRDECHGRFLSLSNFIQSPRHPQTDCALVLLVTPREETLCRNFLDRLPGHLPIVLIRTDIASSLGSIDLLYKMSVFTSVFGEQYRGSNPNDPENLGGFQKGAFRDLVTFQDDFRLYGSLELGASDVPYTDRLLLNSNPTGVDILGLHFSNIEVPYLLAAFNDSRDALKTQQYILNPEKGYLNNPQRIRRDFLEDRFHAKCRRAMEFEKPGCRWCAEWKKFLLGEPADADILNDAYINWLGSTLRFTRQNDGTLQVETVTPSTPTSLPTRGIIGGIVGEVLGSKFELEKDKQKVKALAGKPHLKPSVSMTYTADTVLSLAIAKWLIDDPTHDKQNLIDLFKHLARRYASYSFGKNFQKWVKSDSREPYSANTNGSAMRVAPVAWYAKTLDECLTLAKTTAEITHNSEEGIRGAQAIAAAIFLNRTGHSKSDVKSYIEQIFGYNLNRTTDEIRPSYAFETACDKSVPESIICFLESESFEDAVIRAISLGGDTDTMGCMAGNIAAASMDVPAELATFAYEKLPLELREILDRCNCQIYV
jgi:ADP-ribosylglycohydrolase